MAWTQADLDAINAAISTGAKRVRFQTHEVEYQSLSDQLRVRDLIIGELAGPGSDNRVMLTEYEGGY
jgi:hypothetical protein